MARRIDTATPLPILTGDSPSEVAASSLLALDGLEQGLEVAGAEALGTFTLDDLEEDGRPIGDRLAEDLQEIAVLILVDENAELLERVPRKGEVSESISYVHVVAVWHGEEADAARTQ